MHQYLVQWDGDEVEVVPADDSSEVSVADMNAWDAEGQEPISGIALEDCDRIEATKNDSCWSYPLASQNICILACHGV